MLYRIRTCTSSPPFVDVIAVIAVAAATRVPSCTVCNFSYEWQVGHVKGDLQYKQFTSQHVHAELGIRLGLRGINITLKGTDVGVSTEYTVSASTE